MLKDRLLVQTLVKKNVEYVWDVYHNPKHIINWNHASDDWYCPTAMNDLVVGGKFTYRMSSNNDKYSFDFEGVYTKIEEPSFFAYVMTDGREVDVYFRKHLEGTEIFIFFDPEKENPKELQQMGWQSILDNFKLYTESL